MGIESEKLIIKPLDNDGLTNAFEVQDINEVPLISIKDDGTINFDYLADTTSRVAEINPTGGMTASKELVEFVVNVSVDDTQGRNLVSDSWTGNSFERDGLEGQWGISGNYEYRCVSSMGLWTRYPANKEYQDVFITDGEVIGSLTDDANWSAENNYVETDPLILAKIFNGQYYFSPFYEYKYFVYDISGKKISRQKLSETIYFASSGIIADGSLGVIVPAGYRIKNILLEELGAVSGATINIGTTSTGTEIVNGSVLATSGLNDCTIVQQFFSLYFNQEVFISSASWGSANVTVRIKIERAV